MDDCACHSETHIRPFVMLHRVVQEQQQQQQQQQRPRRQQASTIKHGACDFERQAFMHKLAIRKAILSDMVRAVCLILNITSPWLRCLIMSLSHQQGERGLQAVRLCGEGGYGSVMIVKDPGTGQLRAIKYQVRPLLLHSWVWFGALKLTQPLPCLCLPYSARDEGRVPACVAVRESDPGDPLG
jgi:hypothetical protein